MRLIHSGFLAVVLLGACGGADAPRTAMPPPVRPAAGAIPAPTERAARPTERAARPTGTVEPTVLTDAQKLRDAALAPMAASIVDAYPNWNGFFSSLVANFTPDGRSFVFGSLRDGAPELYLADVNHPGTPPRALTTGPERALSADITADGKSILFLRDENGDEEHAIWRVNLDGTGLTNLTPGPKVRRGQPRIPRGLPKTMFYDVRNHTELSSTFVMQSIDKDDAKIVFKQPVPGWLNDVSPDGKRLAIVSFRGKNDGLLSEVDVATGRARAVYPLDASKTTIHDVHYSADGSRLLVSTNEGRESAVLLALDARSGKEVARYVNDPPTAKLGFCVSPKGDRISLQIDLGNHSEVRILDAATLKVLHVAKVPLGEVSLGTFTSDGRLFSVLVSLPTQPADVFAVDVATGDVHPLRADKRTGLDALTPLVASIAPVAAHDGLTLPINVYLPKLASPRKLPTIAIFHGGPQISYAVRWSLYVRFFVSLGYAVLEPNVRGSGGFGTAYEKADDREKRADWLRDLATVNAWAKSQPWCDAERVVVWGQSYGGYTTLMAVTRQPALWRAGVDLYGMADMKTMFRNVDPIGKVIMAGEFGDLEKDAALLEEFSPMRDVEKILRPLFVYAGEHDARVPRSESDAIVRALRARNMPVEYMVAANEGHGVDHRETKIELMTRTARFLADALQDAPTTVPTTTAR